MMSPEKHTHNPDDVISEPRGVKCSYIRRAAILICLLLLAVLLVSLTHAVVRNTFLDKPLQSIFLNDLDDEKIKHFPDIDYAFLGYNILKGYPLAVGHDLGFTHPIFKADYSNGRKTADRRYNLPEGINIIPDVSCVTSFTSDEVTTIHEFDSALAAQAEFHIDVFGISFSASSEYKQASSSITSGETVYVLSKAFCNYYFARLNMVKLPPFDKDFLAEAEKLASADIKVDSEQVSAFLDYYGTHFATDMKFGAKFIYQFKMSTRDYQEMKSSSYNILARAKYAGIFYLDVGFELDRETKSAALQFMKKVETKTITVGAAPPNNGSAMEWASTVKDTPVPTEYRLQTLDKLFTEKYMGSVHFDYKAVGEKLANAIFGGHYCRNLLKKGIVDSCENHSNKWVVLDKVQLKYFSSRRETTEAICFDQCLKDYKCLAFSFCKKQRNCPEHNCFFFSRPFTNAADYSGTEGAEEWESVILTSKLNLKNTSFSIRNLWLEGSQQRDTSIKSNSWQNCYDQCKMDPNCKMLNFCGKSETWCSTLRENCRFFGSISEQVKIVYKGDNAILTVVNEL